MTQRKLVWFRNDLRTDDNPALHDALDAGPTVGVFLVADEQWRSHHVGPRRLAFLRDTVLELKRALDVLGVPLWIERAATFEEAPEAIVGIAREVGADAVYLNAEYPVNERNRDRQLYRACRAERLGFERRHGGVILPPGSVSTGQGGPYTVFTPFKRRWLDALTPDDYTPLPDPVSQERPELTLPSADEALATLPAIEQPAWPAGETEARTRLTRFLDERAERYASERDFPDIEGTSRLSPYLSIGAISARRCLSEARARNDNRLNAKAGAHPGLDTWISEVVWREFYRHVIAAFPHVSYGYAFRRELDALRWRDDAEALERWREGMTGYPIVDAGMRQLKETGWMHNRLRMITAMFFSKHLLLDWRLGERHFMEQLIDGDFAANNGGWQWSASTGTDAAPYFRIFNPTTQAKRFDPDGAFVRRFVPELASGSELKLGGGYPEPVVEHSFARQRAIDHFKAG